MGRPGTCGLDTTDRVAFRRADHACQLLGVSTLDTHLRLLRGGSPLGGWFEVMRQADQTSIDDVIAAAVEALPLGRIATGPADELGLGPGFEAHGGLDFVLQDLRRWPGRGWPLIAAGLASPVTRNRNMAIAALAEWPRHHWPDGAEDALRAAGTIEPVEQVRERIHRALAGDPLEP